MRYEQLIMKDNNFEYLNHNRIEGNDAQVVFYTGNQDLITNPDVFQELRQKYPHANIVGCSSAAGIMNEKIYENQIIASAIQFDQTPVFAISDAIDNYNDAYELGQTLGKKLLRDDLCGIFILSSALVIGSDLVTGVKSVMPPYIPIVGGLASNTDFNDTYVGLNEVPIPRVVVALACYGPNIVINTGCAGGWNIFGHKRLITRSKGNTLYELDGKPALDLYEHYLGEDAKDLLKSALIFPMQVYPQAFPQTAVIRTMLNYNREEKAMHFAGGMIEGHYAQLMHGSHENIIEGSKEAASMASPELKTVKGLSFLVSCVGRKELLQKRAEQEIQAAASELLNDNHCMIGFYSLGEISPHPYSKISEFHNETMTITTLTERE
jgi:hypothetical protein